MDPIIVSYQGLPLELTPITNDEEQRVYGYGLTCPSCHRDFFINTGIGRKPDHHVARNPQSQVTILPPIRCPFHCGWCVRIVDDIAYTCGNRRAGDLAPDHKSV